MTLTLSIATQIAQAALAAGAADNVTALSVVVTDAGGHLRVAMRADGVGTFGIDVAHAKAATALGFNRASMQMAKAFGANPGAVAALTAATGGRFLPIGGGVLIHDHSGNLLGAAAVAGSAPENDEKFIVAGIQSAGLVVPI
jgi:uncharacterized protein GlcG (DUF336 family)